MFFATGDVAHQARKVATASSRCNNRLSIQRLEAVATFLLPGDFGDNNTEERKFCQVCERKFLDLFSAGGLTAVPRCGRFAATKRIGCAAHYSVSSTSEAYNSMFVWVSLRLRDSAIDVREAVGCLAAPIAQFFPKR